jgi:hypothetical protein
MDRCWINRWPSHAIGACGALLVHGLMLEAMSLGASAPKHRSERETGPGASALLSGADPIMTLVLVQLPGVMRTDQLEQLASRGAAAASAAIEVLSPDPAPALEIDEAAETDENSEAPQWVGDPAMRSMLFGRYTGQIDARIERAWIKPRSPVVESKIDLLAQQVDRGEDDHRFRCTVRIIQDIDGKVGEVELIQCNGTVAWQQSIVNAIQRASPLPAPPTPAVFTNALTLRFEARQYVPGGSAQDYEPELLNTHNEAPVLWRSDSHE